MSGPWVPEIAVDAALARALITAQFPAFAEASVAPFGSGWDNAAFLVDGRIVFRFPQRAVAAPLIEREIALLPLIAPHLPLPVPNPQYAGAASARFPWRFAGYERLAGVTSCTRVLPESALAALADALARFLRALHDLDASPLLARGLLGDTIAKISPERLGIDEPPLEDAPRVVHGDLYARHLLIDDDDRLCGVIDWGDLHYASPAVDLAAVYLLLPPALHARFFAIYGEVAPRVLRFARLRARHHAQYTLDYARRIGDIRLARAVERGLAFTAASE